MNLDFGSASAQAIYEQLQSKREPFVRRAEESAAYTIPSVFPRRGHDGSTDFIPPRASLGAQAVNNLSNKITAVLIPSNAQFFRHIPDRAAREALEELDDKARREVDATLSQIEQDVRHEIERQAIRVPTHESVVHLVVTGNALTYYPEKGGMEFFPLSKYVVARDGSDNVLCIVIREQIAHSALDDDQADAAGVTFTPDTPDGEEAGYEVFTKVWWDGAAEKWYSVQQIGGVDVPGTDGTYKKDECPWRPLRWNRIHGEAYGRGICEEYIGTIRTVEQLTKAIAEGALAASRILPLIRPGATTDLSAIHDAENGEPVFGHSDDITFMQVDKYADLRVAKDVLDTERRALQSAFLMNSSITRDAERVTAEEIRIMAQELESSLGGIYANLSVEFQLPLVENVQRQLTTRGLLPKFDPKVADHLKPTILTGIDALGRREELDRTIQAFEALKLIAGPEVYVQYLDIPGLISDVFAKASVSKDGLIKSEEQVQQERQQAQAAAQQQAMIERGTGPLAKGLADNPEVLADVARQATGGAPTQ